MPISEEMMELKTKTNSPPEELAAAVTAKMMLNAAAAMEISILNSTKYQYSLRRARPVKAA